MTNETSDPTPDEQTALAWRIVLVVCTILNVSALVYHMWPISPATYFYSTECRDDGFKVSDANGTFTLPDGILRMDEVRGFLQRTTECKVQLQILSLQEVD